MENQLSVLLKAKLDANKSEINKEIDKLSTQINKLKIKLDLDTSDLASLKSTMEDVKRIMNMQSKKFKLFDGEQLKKDGIEVFTTLEQVENKFKDLGRISYSNKIFDPITKELTGFTMQLEKADGVVDKLKYNLINIGNGDQISKAFTLQGLNQIDKTSQINEKILQEKQKINQKLQQEEVKISKQKMDLLHAEALEMNSYYDKRIANEERAMQETQRIRMKLSKDEMNRLHSQALEMNNYYDSRKKQEQDLFNYKQKMLGGDGFKGQLEIFADKNKGNYDKTLLDNLRKQINGLSVDTPNLQSKIKQLSNEFTSLKYDATQAGSVIQRSFENMYKFMRFYIAGGMVVGAINGFKSAIQFVKDFDDSLVDLSKVVNLSESQMIKMKISAIELGKELGKSSIEIMKGMAEWGRYTKNLEEIQELTKVATIASNVSDLSVQEASKAMTTAMIDYKLEVKDMMPLLDSFNEIQNNMRVSAKDLADGISRVGNAAAQSKTPLSSLQGYISAIVQATGSDGAEVGTALKSAISRVFRIGEEGAEDAGKSEEQLKKIGVAVRDASGDFRAFSDIIDDTASKWKTLSNVEQVAIAQTIGGTHHYSKIIGLFENYDLAIKATTLSLNSQGSAMRENEKYVDSITGRTEKLKTTLQGIFNQTISSDGIKSFVSGLNQVILTFGNLETVVAMTGTALLLWKGKAITDTIKGLKDFSLVTKMAGSEVKLFKEISAAMQLQQMGAITTTQMLTFSFAALGTSIKTAFMSNPLGWIAIGITSVITAMDIFNSKQEDSKNKLKQTIDGYKEQQLELNSILESYKKNAELAKTDENAKKQLYEIEEQLVNIFGESAKVLDLQNGNIDDNISKIKQLREEKLKNIIAENQYKALESKNLLDKKSYGSPILRRTSSDMGSDFYRIEQDKSIFSEKVSMEEYYNELLEMRQRLVKSTGEFSNLSDKQKITLSKDINKEIDDTNNILKQNKGIIELVDNANKELIKTQLSGLEKLKPEQKSLFDSLSKNINFDNVEQYTSNLSEVAKVISENSGNMEVMKKKLLELPFLKTSNDVKGLESSVKDNTFSQEKYNKALEEQNKVIDTFQSTAKELSSVYNDLNENEKVSADTLLDLIQKYPEYATQIANMNSSKEAGISITKTLFEIEKQKAVAVLEQNKAELQSRLDILAVKEEEFKLDKEWALENLDNPAAQAIIPTVLSKLSAIENLRKKLGNIDTSIDLISGLEISTYSKPKKDDSTSPIDKEPDYLSPTIDRYTDLQTAIDEVTNAISRLKAEEEGLEGQARIDNLEKQIELNKQLAKAKNDFLWEQKKERNDLRYMMQTQGFDFTGDFDSTNSSSNYATKLQQMYDIYNNMANKTDAEKQARADMLNIIKNMEDAYKRILQLNKDVYSTENDIINIGKENNKIKVEQAKILEEIAKQQEELRKKQLEENRKLQEELQKQNEEKLKSYNEVEDQIVDLLKQKYEQQDKLAEEHKNKEDKRLEESLDNYKNYIQEQIDELDRLKDAQDYNEDVEDLNKQILKDQQEKNKFNLAVKSGDMESISRVKELDEKIDENKKQLSKKQRDREFSLRKENLQDMLKSYEEYVNSEKKKNEDSLESAKAKTKELMDDNKLKLEAQNLLISGSLETTKQAVINLFTETGNNATNAGLVIQNTLLSKLSAIREVSKELTQLQGGIKGNNPLGMSVNDFATYVQNKKNWTDGIDREKAAKDNAQLRFKYGIDSDEYNYDQLKGYYANGTPDVQGILSMVGEGGREIRVLNPNGKDSIIPNSITENLVKLGTNPLDFFRNLSGNMPKLSTVASGVGGYHIQNQFDINIHGNPDKNTVELLFKQLASKFNSEMIRSTQYGRLK